MGMRFLSVVLAKLLAATGVAFHKWGIKIRHCAERRDEAISCNAVDAQGLIEYDKHP